MARVALVTGGQRGIGAGISEALAKAGHKVVANYAGNDAAAQEFTGRTGIPCFKFDVGNYQACADAVKRIEAEVGPIDILVNNAGITRDTTIKRMTPEMWDAVIQTNLTSCWNLSKLVWDGMTSRKFGRIINISSINGLAGQFGQTNYSAAKAGVIGLTKALAQEGARANITANAIAPGYIDTEMVRAVAPDVLEKIIAKIPRARLGSVEDIARGVVFLAADDADWITGSTLSINGGQYMY